MVFGENNNVNQQVCCDVLPHNCPLFVFRALASHMREHGADRQTDKQTRIWIMILGDAGSIEQRTALTGLPPIEKKQLPILTAFFFLTA